MMRDMVGYAGKWPNMHWPNGARLAVSVAVNFEEGAEQQVGDGDAQCERIGEVISVVAPGLRDMGQEQIFAYGTRAGFWRMLDALDHHAIPATFLMCGRAVERAPTLAAEATRRGHEAAAHGWLWRPQADYTSREAEAADLDRCIAAITNACGEAPQGFFCRGSESIWTRGLLQERGFTWVSNAFDDDVPYDDPAYPGLSVLPYALDVLLEEAASGKPRLLNIGYHLRIVGRPARFPAFEKILARLAELGDQIWVARRIDIAKAWRAATRA